MNKFKVGQKVKHKRHIKEVGTEKIITYVEHCHRPLSCPKRIDMNCSGYHYRFNTDYHPTIQAGLWCEWAIEPIKEFFILFKRSKKCLK